MKLYKLIAIFLFLTSCADNDVSVISGKTMGTTYMVKAVNSTVSKTTIDNRLWQINNTFSTWDSASELSKLNNAPVNKWIDISNDLYLVLAQAKKINQQTQGFFDPGIGKLIDLWGFGAVSSSIKPTRKAIEESKIEASIDNLVLDNNKVKKLKDISINLSAIAKGYGVDEIARLLANNGADSFMIEIGGEVFARGSNLGSNWVVGIEMPNNQTPIAIKLKNEAVASSGDYRNYFIWEGKKYMHIINPNTGLPAKTDLSSVSVINSKTMLADAYATAMMAMGSEKAQSLANKLNLKTIMILNEEHSYKILKVNL